MLLALLAAATAPGLLAGIRPAVLPRAPVVPSPTHLEPVDSPYESLAKMTLSTTEAEESPEAPVAKGASVTQLCNDWASRNRHSNAHRVGQWYGVSVW